MTKKKEFVPPSHWTDEEKYYASIGEWGFTPISLVGAEEFIPRKK